MQVKENLLMRLLRDQSKFIGNIVKHVKLFKYIVFKRIQDPKPINYDHEKLR